tara:strand:- start:32 stop:358 length:327 start_codon:yes stop_codon:yes gene_type:complete
MGESPPVGFMDRPSIEVDLMPNAIRLRYAQAELRWAIEGLTSLLVADDESPHIGNFVEILHAVGAAMAVVESDLRDPDAWMKRQQRAADITVTHTGGIAGTLDRDAKH